MQNATPAAHLATALALALGTVACADEAEEAPISMEHREIRAHASAITQAASWTGYMSEEFGGPLLCPAGQVVVGAECIGSFCDQIRLRCDAFGGSLNTTGEVHWTGWVETNGEFIWSATIKDAECAPGEWMVGLDCRGSYCDDVRVACRASNSRAVNCESSSLYSEETGPYNAPDGRFLIGVHCEGQHCDNKTYRHCSARPPAEQSCNGRCGGAATSGSCWCDSLCEHYGDCCTDKVDFCG